MGSLRWNDWLIHCCVLFATSCLLPTSKAQPPAPIQPPPLPEAPAPIPPTPIPPATPAPPPGAPATPPQPTPPPAPPAEKVEGSPFQPIGRVEGEPGYVGLVVDTEKNGRGIIVLQVVAGGPAARADIQHGDVLFRANGSELKWADQLGALLRPLRPGGKVELQIRRGDNLVKTTVVLGKRPEGEKPTAHLGIEMSAVDVVRASRLGLPVKAGVMVERVAPGSAADEARIQQGSVIVQFGEHRIGSPSDMWKAVSAHQPGDVVNVQLYEGARMRSLFVRLSGSLRTDADTPRFPQSVLRPKDQTAESVLAK